MAKIVKGQQPILRYFFELAGPHGSA